MMIFASLIKILRDLAFGKASLLFATLNHDLMPGDPITPCSGAPALIYNNRRTAQVWVEIEKVAPRSVVSGSKGVILTITQF